MIINVCNTVTDDVPDAAEVGVTKAVELATKASKWSQTYLGTPLSKLPLDPTTVTEVLRYTIVLQDFIFPNISNA